MKTTIFKISVLVLLQFGFSSQDLPFRDVSRVARTGMNPDQFLERFGYLPETKPDVQHSYEARQEAIKNFQRMYNLPVTGTLNKMTRTRMLAPRCGLPDVFTNTKNQTPPKGVQHDPTTDRKRPENYYAPGYKWKKTNLRWRATKYTRQLPVGSQRRAFTTAFKFWSDITPLTITETGDHTPDIEIQFGAREHGDGYGNSFDGPSGILAHAFFPEDGSTHFDDEEKWTEGIDQGTNLMIVSAHEFGHALGLGHSNVKGSLMAPYYQGYDPNFKLSDDDIAAIQSLYGANVQPPKPTTRPPTQPKPTTPSGTGPTTGKPDTCTTKFDAIMYGHDHRMYVFHGKHMWRLNNYGVESYFKGGRLIAKYFAKAPYNMGAAVYSWKSRFTYFFKGRKVFKFYGRQKVDATKFMKRNISPQAALIDREGKIQIFSGTKYYTFDESRADVISTAGRPISENWPGVPGNVEAAIRMHDGFIYFFKGSRYRKFSEREKKVLPGYPKEKAAPWMGAHCGGTQPPK
eukprot:GHVU01065998.1.p1 GENE.GHVU01065998.1~~GHVU01065998.1.p1  ORF type:complete len:526 (-),score=42.79 GHVU01065998.1:330-1874(-)